MISFWPSCRPASTCFRLNFAHGEYADKARIVAAVRKISEELEMPIGLLGDLAGPKIRLGTLPPDGLSVREGERYAFIRESAQPGGADEAVSTDPFPLTCSYPGLIDDLRTGNRILLADGMVSMRVIRIEPDRAICEVEQPGRLLTRQGINLPHSHLQLPSLTDKDERDLDWALEHGLDFVSLSFVRRAEDVRSLRARIEQARPATVPLIVAKIEKPEAVDALEEILAETDVVMVARGDLGVEVDIVRVPAIQKRIIRACNEHRVPVITATQMLESMQQNELPTRAEATDVANAVLDGSDAVMLSAETAVGRHPVRVVSMMNRIVREIEPLVVSRKDLPLGRNTRNTATELTRAVTLGAIHAAEQIQARLLVVQTRSGATAGAVSELRSGTPILALTDDPQTARRLSVTWGVRGLVTDVCHGTPQEVADFTIRWGREQGILASGDRFVTVGTTDWSQPGKNLTLVHAVP
jgi:pyruvate kinase